MASNPYVNKVQLADGTTLIDISDSTATASDVASGKYFYTAAGVKTQGTASGGSAIVVTEEQDSAGGIIKHITAVDISSDTVDAAHLLYGYTAHNSSGTAITGEYVPSGSSLQTKSETYTPTTSQQTDTITPDTGYDGLSSVGITINAVPTGTATAPSTISGTSATVSTGTNTITLSKTVSVTPNVSTAGYISSGTAGNSNVSLTASVTTKAAATIHPSSSSQSIASGTYLTGAQTINAVTTTNLSASNILSGVTIKVGDSSDDDCVASVTGNVTFSTYYTGSSVPSSSLGVDGDIYLQTGS